MNETKRSIVISKILDLVDKYCTDKEKCKEFGFLLGDLINLTIIECYDFLVVQSDEMIKLSNLEYSEDNEIKETISSICNTMNTIAKKMTEICAENSIADILASANVSENKKINTYDPTKRDINNDSGCYSL